MSHELRTPLNSIIGFSSILQQELPGPLNEEQHKQMGMIKQSALHLLDLINDILDTSKIEAGVVDLVNESVNLADLVEEVGMLLKPLADEKGLQFNISGAEQLPTIQTDKCRLKQVLMNLANNAIKFTSAGEVDINCSLPQEQVCVIEVCDTGIGLAAKDIENIFLPFKQVKRGIRSYENGGAGLGLSISKQLINMLGGEIKVESVFGKGSKFSIILTF